MARRRASRCRRRRRITPRFRTPSLRNVTLSAPYGHNGRFATLAEAIDFHGPIDPADRDQIVRFLGSLAGAYPLPPWNDWPQH